MCQFGDGITFLIIGDAEFFSLNNGFMGLPETNLKSQESFVAVEFETNYDPSLGDTNENHIGIDVNTIFSFASVDTVSKGVDVKPAKQITDWTGYSDEKKFIKIWICYS